LLKNPLFLWNPKVHNPQLDKLNCMQILKPRGNVKEETIFLYGAVNILNLVLVSQVFYFYRKSEVKSVLTLTK
jgi:hypothetical protein